MHSKNTRRDELNRSLSEPIMGAAMMPMQLTSAMMRPTTLAE